MPLSIKNNISALHALAAKQTVNSNNVANLASSKFKKSTTVLEAGGTGSVSAKIQQVDTPSAMITRPDGSVEELSNVDLGQELIGMISTQHGNEADLKALQVNQEMEDKILDLIG